MVCLVEDSSPPPVVGRAAELAVLDRLVSRALAGTGGAVLLGGEPGIGKTRLAVECAQRATAGGARVAWGRCRESADTPPLWPWTQILRQLGRPVADLAAGPEIAARFQLFERICAALAEVARGDTLLLILDDTHRADEASLRLLAHLGDVLWPAAIGLVIGYRDVDLRPGGLAGTVLADLAGSAWCRHCPLSGLSRAEVAGWLGERWRDSVDEVYDRTDGNPLFVGEVVRSLSEGRDGAVPASVRDLITLRLFALPEATRGVLETAAILGRDFDYPQLSAALRMSPTATIDALGPAEAARLITADATRSGSYRFVHALVREAVEAQLPGLRRADLHARVFAALRDTGCPVATDVAHHAVQARPVVDDAVAAQAARAAAEASETLLAWEDAARWWRIVLDLSADDNPEVALRLGRGLLLSGQVNAGRERFEAVAAAAACYGDDATFAVAALAVGDTVAEVAADEGLLALLDRALRGTALPADQRVRLTARRAIATYWQRDGQQESRQHSAHAVELARAAGDPHAWGEALIARQFTLRGPDLLAERIEAGEAVLAIADRLGDEDLRFRACQWLVPDRFQAGDIDGALREVAVLAATAHRTRDPLRRWRVTIYRGLLAAAAGRLEEAERLAEDAGRLGRRLGQAAAEPYRLGQLGRLWWRTGRLPQLVEDLIAGVRRFPGLPTLRANLALAYAEAGDRERALATANELAADGFAALPRDSLYLASLAILGEVAVGCAEPRLAAMSARALQAYAEENLIQGVPVGWGSAAWHLARMFHVCGRAEAAVQQARTAERLHAAWRAGGWGDPFADLDRDGGHAPLSRREAQVLALLAAGRANQEIATALLISVHTVERHVANIFLKLSVRNRAEATGWAHRRGLIR